MGIAKIPILADKLALPERVSLSSVVHHPGFSVIVKMLEAACEDATNEVMRVDPEEENYERILSARQQRSRYSHELSRRLLDSIQYHIDVFRQAHPEAGEIVAEPSNES